MRDEDAYGGNSHTMHAIDDRRYKSMMEGVYLIFDDINQRWTQNVKQSFDDLQQEGRKCKQFYDDIRQQSDGRKFGD